MLTVFIVVCLLLNLGILNFNVFLLHFRIALTMQSPWAISCLPSVFIHMILLNFSHVYYFQWLLFYIDSVHSCERHLITHKAKHNLLSESLQSLLVAALTNPQLTP